MIMKRTYWVVMLLAVFLGVTLLLAKTAGVAAAAPSGIKNVVLVPGGIRRRLRLGRRRKDP